MNEKPKQKSFVITLPAEDHALWKAFADSKSLPLVSAVRMVMSEAIQAKKDRGPVMLTVIGSNNTDHWSNKTPPTYPHLADALGDVPS